MLLRLDSEGDENWKVIGGFILNNKIFIKHDPHNPPLMDAIKEAKKQYQVAFNPINETWCVPIEAQKLFGKFAPTTFINEKPTEFDMNRVTVCADVSKVKYTNYLVLNLPDHNYTVSKKLEVAFHAKKTQSGAFFVPEQYALKVWNVLKGFYEIRHATDNCKRFLTNLWNAEQQKDRVVAEAVKHVPKQIIGFNGQLYDFQERDLGFLLRAAMTTKRRAYLANDIGTGKTVVSIAFVLSIATYYYHQQLQNGGKNGFRLVGAIIICPKVLKYQWESEVKKFTAGIEKYLGRKMVLDMAEGRNYNFNEDADWTFVNYDIAKDNESSLIKLAKKRILICDEAQALSYWSKRTRALLKISRTAWGVILASGTPFDAKVSQLWYQLRCLNQAYKIAPSLDAFRRDYAAGFKGKWGFVEKGAKPFMLPVLRHKMRHFFVRTSNKVLGDKLPKITRMCIEVDLPPQILREYRRAEEDIIQYVEMRKGYVAATKAEKAEELAKLNVLIELSSKGKVPAAIELINTIMENDKKFLLFSYRKEPLYMLYETFKKHNVGLLVGGGNRKDLNRFMANKLPGLLMSADAGGVGLNLIQACVAVFLNQPWVPGKKLQNEGRIWRDRQTFAVLVYNLIARGTIDLKMCKTIDQRVQDLRGLFGEQKEKLYGDDISQEIIQHLQSDRRV